MIGVSVPLARVRFLSLFTSSPGGGERAP